ncbi:hypothetical protein HK096_008235, partial [Nowakowskiella sp. JEL0078]
MIKFQIGIFIALILSLASAQTCSLPTALLSSRTSWDGASIGLNTCGRDMSPNPLTDRTCICNKESFNADVVGCMIGSGINCVGQSELFSTYGTSFCVGTSSAAPSVISVVKSSSVAAVVKTTTVTPVITTTAIQTTTSALTTTIRTTTSTLTTTIVIRNTSTIPSFATVNATVVSAEATTTTSSSQNQNNGSNTLIIVGIVLSSVAIVSVLATVFFQKWWRHNPSEPKNLPAESARQQIPNAQVWNTVHTASPQYNLYVEEIHTSTQAPLNMMNR